MLLDLIKMVLCKKKARTRCYPVEIIIDTDYVDDIAFLANTPNQAESLLHSLEQAVEGIGLHVYANKTEYTCFKWWSSEISRQIHVPRQQYHIH